MTKMKAILMSSALAISAIATGCQTTTGMNQNDTPSSITTYQITNAALQANNWQLVDAKNAQGNTIDALVTNQNKPLTLNFMTVEGNNLVNLMNTCNNISSPYQVKNGEVKLGSIMSTMMACPDAEAEFDKAAISSVMGKYTLSQAGDKSPVLVVTNDNQVSHFKAVPKKTTK